MAKVNFSVRTLQSLPVPPTAYKLHMDSTVSGLGLKIEKSGHRSFFWRRKAGGRLHWYSLGAYQDLTIDAARAAASARNVQLAEWKQRGYVGAPPWERPASITLQQAVDAYRDRYIAHNARKPERTKGIVDQQMRDHCGKLKHRELAQLTRRDFVELREKVYASHGTYASNRLIEMLRASLNFCISVDLWSGPNPVAKLGRFEEVKRERFLLPDERARLEVALNSPETPVDLADFVRLALFCGARKADVLGMAWKDVDMQRQVWLVPMPKSGRPYYIPLAPQAVEVLQQRLARAAASDKPPSPWVFPSRHSHEVHLLDVKNSWGEMMERAKIEDFRIHDLRRTFGSVQAEAGESLIVIGKTLGHAPGSPATSVYARLQELEAMRRSINAAVTTIVNDMQKQLPQDEKAAVGR